MEKEWAYKNYQIKEGLKPGSAHFQYFFGVSKDNQKTCNYCIWIEDEALSRFDRGKDFKAIISSHNEAWKGWVKKRIDAEDFQNRVLKFKKRGQEEIDLSEMREHVRMD